MYLGYRRYGLLSHLTLLQGEHTVQGSECLVITFTGTSKIL